MAELADAPDLGSGSRKGVEVQVLLPAPLSITVGLCSAVAVTRLLENLLFDVPAYDPLTYASVSALIAAVAFVAGWLPARRAARIDPFIALRAE